MGSPGMTTITTPYQVRLPLETRLDAEFAAWRAKHPEAWRELADLCLRWRHYGHTRWSVKAAFEVVRWERAVAGLPAPDEEYKLNNNLTSRVARALMAENPALAGMFELRELRG